MYATLRRLDERVVDAALCGVVVDAHVENRRGAVEPRAGVVLSPGLRKRLLSRLAVLELEDVDAALVLEYRVRPAARADCAANAPITATARATVPNPSANRERRVL